MTKALANEIKKAIGGDRYTTNYQSKTGVLRIKVCEECNSRNEDNEQKAIIKTLTRLTESGYRPRFTIETKTYQGFIHMTYIVLQ